MTNVEQLREAKSLNEAQGILNRANASAAVRKLVEVSFMTRTSPDKTTQEYGMSCLNEAVSTLKDSEQPAIPESPGLKTKGDSFVKEEVLDNHNPTQRDAGSEQSTDNTPPYPQEGTQDGDEDMQNAPDTENQLTEALPGMMPGMPPGMMPSMENGFGLDPSIAAKMGNQMPQIPPMNSGDQIQQMQYTVKEALKPFIKHMQVQDKAIKTLSKQIKETQMQKGSLSLEHALNSHVRETVTPEVLPITPVRNTQFDLNEKRSRLIQVNDMMNQSKR